MKFLTVMIVVYTTSQGPVESRFLFPSAEECGGATEVISQVLPYGEVDVSCHQTSMLSESIRPKARGDQ